MQRTRGGTVASVMPRGRVPFAGNMWYMHLYVKRCQKGGGADLYNESRQRFVRRINTDFVAKLEDSMMYLTLYE